MNNTKRICYLAVLTALYVVLSAFLKFNIVGNIQLDLGYIVFAFALCEFGIYGTIVGVFGCSLESILFSAYGFSISWATANLIVGIVTAFVFYFNKNDWIKIAGIIVSTALGLLLAKTFIECALYSIPFEVKIAKNAVAFGIDTIVMIFGYFIHKQYFSNLNLKLQ